MKKKYLINKFALEQAIAVDNPFGTDLLLNWALCSPQELEELDIF